MAEVHPHARACRRRRPRPLPWAYFPVARALAPAPPQKQRVCSTHTHANIHTKTSTAKDCTAKHASNPRGRARARARIHRSAAQFRGPAAGGPGPSVASAQLAQGGAAPRLPAKDSSASRPEVGPICGYRRAPILLLCRAARRGGPCFGRAPAAAASAPLQQSWGSHALARPPRPPPHMCLARERVGRRSLLMHAAPPRPADLNPFGASGAALSCRSGAGPIKKSPCLARTRIGAPRAAARAHARRAARLPFLSLVRARRAAARGAAGRAPALHTPIGMRSTQARAALGVASRRASPPKPRNVAGARARARARAAPCLP